jgi:hypothetical protein
MRELLKKFPEKEKKGNIIFSLIVSRINRRTKNLYEIIINEENKEI